MSRVWRATALALLGVAFGCGGENAAAPKPRPFVARLSGDNQNAEIGQSLANPLVVQVTDGAGTPLANQEVEWVVAQGGGYVAPISTVTDEQGHASATWTLGDSVGTQRLGAVVDRVGVSFTATGNPHPPPPPPPPPCVQPIVAHFDGTSWTASVQHGCGSGAVTAIWAAPSTVIAVGDDGFSSFYLKYDRSQWTEEDPQAYFCCFMPSMSGVSASDLFAVRNYIAHSGTHWTSVQRYDGQSWATVYVSEGFFPNLQGVWSNSPTDVVVVGDQGHVLHYDGSNWTEQSSATTDYLTAVWGDRATGIYFAVGVAGRIIYFDGLAWHPQTSGTAQNLRGVWGSSPNDVFAVGDSGSILHFDGTSWTSQTSGTTSNLLSVWGNASNSVFVGGANSTMLHYDGSAWTPQSVPLGFVHAISGTSGTDVFAAGGSIR